MKKVLCIIVILTIFLISGNALAKDNNIFLVINGYCYLNAEPVMIDDRVLVPVRTIFESLGLKVDWNEETKTITAAKEDKVVVLTIDNNEAEINNTSISLGVAPQIIDDRTMVPVRFIAESFNSKVDWNEEENTVTILSEDYTPIDRDYESMKYLDGVTSIIKVLNEYITNSYSKISDQPEAALNDFNSIKNQSNELRVPADNKNSAYQLTQCIKYLGFVIDNQIEIEKLDESDERVPEMQKKQDDYSELFEHYLNSIAPNLKLEADNFKNIIDVQVFAPCDGKISDFYLKEGDRIGESGIKIAQITDDSRLKANISFTSSQIQQISVGQAAQLIVPQFMTYIDGTVTHVSDVSKPGSDGAVLYDVEITIYNPGGITKGTQVNGLVKGTNGDIVSPFSATAENTQEQAVYAKVSGIVKRVYIQNGDWVKKGQKFLDLE